MRLADFIEGHAPEILKEWETFAATRVPAAFSMNQLELRDHAPEILRAIVDDLRSVQSADEQLAKSEGRAPVLLDAAQTAAQVHGIKRARSGFDINQMVSEYRALRATVLRLWASSQGSIPLELVVEDMVRFNEAIDQAITESVSLFTEEVERGRSLFLGVLGHELRSPLNAIQMTARYLARLHSEPEIGDAVRHLISSGGRMKWLLDDLLEYSRTKLSLGILIRPAEADLAEICADAVEEIRVSDPDKKVQLRTSGDLRGFWDARRLHQVITNLVSNAMTYRAPGTAVVLEATASEGEIVVSVMNQGPPLPREALHTLFEPLQRGPESAQSMSESTHLGLGLYVSREIVRAHHGQIQASSDAGKTVFRVRLPKRCDAA